MKHRINPYRNTYNIEITYQHLKKTEMKKIWSTLFFLFLSAIFYFTNPDSNNFGILASSLTSTDFGMELANDNLKNDPPVLLSPIGEIEQRSSQFYNFIWQPRHTSSAVVEYELFIFEKIRGLSDQQIVSVTAPVFRTRTLATSYLYSPKDPILKTEQDYLVLIKVQDVKASIYFKNNGRSKIESFRIKTRCVPGEGCDDGKECTFNDRITIDCECKGKPYYDVDQDGTCDPVSLPPPLVVSPTMGVVDTDTPEFTAAWKKQHDYDLDIDYQLNIRQTGVDVEETEAYQQLIAKLEKEKLDFFQELEKNETAFYSEQKDKSDDFESSLLDGDIDCSLVFEDARLNYEEQVITKEKTFDKTIQSVVDNCPTDVKKATTIFNDQLSRERTEFEALQKDAQQIFDAQQQDALAALQAKQNLEKENLKAIQAKDLGLFSKELEIKSFENCGVYETSQADFDERKNELRVERDACLAASEDYKTTVKQKAKTQLKSLKEDEGILKIARGLAKDKYEQLIQDLARDLEVKLKNADTEALRALVNKDHNNALILAKAEYEETLKAIDQRTVTNKKEQDNVKRQRDKDLKNVDQKIAKLQRNCKRTFREAVDLLEKEQLISEGKLEECLNQIDQDSKLFSQAQRDTWNNLEIIHQNELKKFNQKQGQENNRFNQSQETAQRDFNAQLKNRRALFDAEIAGCLLKVDKQKNLYTRSQTFQQAYFETTQLIQSEDCQRRSNDLATKFMESQTTTLLIYQKEKEQKIQDLEETQKNKISQLVDELTKQPENTTVYAKQTKNLSETISLTEAGLKKGYKYVAQVQATDAKQIASFQNDGLSNLWPLQTGKVVPPTRNFFEKDGFAPIAYTPKEIAPTNFVANWSNVAEASYYILEVATDSKFGNRLKGYGEIEVEGTALRIKDVNEKNTYYYRVRAIRKGEISGYSNIIGHQYEIPAPCKVGAFCDDKDPCTINDRVREDCICRGTNEDADKDGICDGLDICKGGDDRVDLDGDKIPDFCDDCVVGTSCSDGDTMTVLDRWMHNPAVDPTQPPPPGVDFCLCVGIPRDQAPCKDNTDSDNDKVCDEWDICPGFDDLRDSDNDGVPDGCDQCPRFDDNLDEDGDGIPDDCDTSPEGCDATLAICPTKITVTLCNSYYLIDPVQEINCWLETLSIQEPGKEEPTRLEDMTVDGVAFMDNYCIQKDCEGNTLESLAVQLNKWIVGNGHQGVARVYRDRGTRKWTILGLYNTDLKIVNVQKGCKGKIYNRKIYERNCREVTQYILSPAIIGACNDPAYQWSTGATTQRITVPTANHIAYTITVTCDDQCTYTTAKLANYDCIPGTVCNDADPCTINDKLNICCECVGTYSGDSDLDGVCDELDRCPGVDDNAVGEDCKIICYEGKPCDDRDTCTTNDVYVFLLKENRCDCRGTYEDSDGDFVCDPLDVCPGHPDWADADMDGIPDGCEKNEICLGDENEPLDYCGAIHAFSSCLMQDNIDNTEQFIDLVELSNMLVDLVSNNPEAILNGEIIITGTDLEGGHEIEIGDLEDGDLNNNNEGVFDVDLIIDGNGNKMDSDGDGVCDLLDICSGSDVDREGGIPSSAPGADPNYRPDGIPDGCPDCVGLTTKSTILAIYLSMKFDRFCMAQIPQPQGYDACEVPGELNCACNCIPDGDDWDADEDGVCDDLDQCHGGNDLEDWDGDGIPNACEEEDPCTADGAPAVADCPPADATCILGGYIAYNDTTKMCECVLIPDGDDDDDSVCNALDKCPGYPDKDEDGNPVDADGDGVPDGCDLCPEHAGGIGSPCDDGESCTTNDVLVYTYQMLPLIEVLAPYQGLYQLIANNGSPEVPDPFEVQEVIKMIKKFIESGGNEGDDLDALRNIWLSLEGTSTSGNTVYALMITGCDCTGYEFDSDYDGVCDGEDICPGFDDSLVDNDYDGDGIPDGCDPPYYEIGCPDAVSFLLDGNYSGIILTFNDPNVIAEQLPITMSFTFNKATLGELFIFENVLISNIQNLANETKVLFELPFDEISDISEVYHSGGEPKYLGVIGYSTGQFCHYDKGRITPDGGTSFGCQESGMFFVENGMLAIGQNFNPQVLINQNTIPATITAIELDFSDASFDTGGSITGQNNTVPGQLLFSTNIAPAEAASDGPLSNPTGFIEFNTGLRCEFGAGGGIVNNCNAQHYIGEPCDDNDHLTAQDRWIIDPADNTCKCQGLFIHDQDGDGVHDTEDICPGGDDNLDANGDGIPDDCECQAPVVATQDFGDGVPVQMIKIRNGTSVEIRLDSLLDANGQAIHNGYSITWDPPTPAPPADPDEQPINITGQEFIINNLAGDETYSITVTGNCVPGGDPSPPLVIEVVIPSNGCELTTEESTCDCTTPLTNLFVGDIVTIGDFPVTISDVTASGATFSGSGYTSMPYFNGILVDFNFEGITIMDCGDSYCVSDGHMYVPQNGSLDDILGDFIGDFDPFSGNLLDDLENALLVLKGKAEDITSTEDYYNDVHDLAGDIASLLPDVPFMDQELVDALNDELDCMAGVPDTESFESCKEKVLIAICDILKHLKDLYDADYQAIFYDTSDPAFTYGLDTQQYKLYNSEYDQIDEIAKKPYSVSWKSVKSGGSSPVNVKPDRAGSFTPTFIDTNKDPIGASPSGSHQQIQVTGKSHGSIQEIYAIQPEAETAQHDHDDPPNGADDPHIHIAGKLNVISYDEQTINLRIVRVGTVQESDLPDLATLETDLNRVYEQAVTKIDLGDSYIDFSSLALNTPLEDLPSGWLSAYNPPMNDIIGDFKDNFTIEDDTYYLFVLPVDNANTSRLGFMPKKRKYGFIFNQVLSNPARFTKTIAHELGHGAFHLNHTFEEGDNSELNGDDRSDNLMDYGETGTLLRKSQWDLIHDPARNFTLFDSDEEAAYTAINNMDELLPLKNDDGTYTFIAPSGKPITLPGTVTAVGFNTGDNIIGNSGTCNKFLIYPFGSLRYFVLDGKHYTTSFICASTTFTRYKNKDDSADIYYDLLTPAMTNLASRKAIVGFPCRENGKTIFNVKNFVMGSVSGIDLTGITGSTYTANGPIVSNHSFVLNSTAIKTVQATGKVYPAYSEEALAFLNSAGELTSCGSLSAFYAFIHAHQITAYPGFYRDCLNGKTTYVKDVEGIHRRLRVRYNYNPYGIPSTYTDVPISDAEIVFWKDQDASIYKIYRDAVDDDWGNFWTNYDHSSFNGTSPSQYTTNRAETLRDLLLKWDGKGCKFNEITPENRLKALELLSVLDLTEQNWWNHWLLYEAEEENLYNAILRAASGDEYPDILALFKGTLNTTTGNHSYELYTRVINKMLEPVGFSDGFDNRGYDDFASILSAMVMEAEAIEGTYPVKHDLSINRTEGGFSYSYDYLINFDGQTITLEVNESITGGSGTPTPTPSDPSSGQPFQYVKVRFNTASAFTIPGTNEKFKAGSEVTIPYCYAEWLFRRYNQAEFDMKSRVAIDFVVVVVAIASAPFTSGASLVFLVADGVYSAVDMAVAADKYNLELTDTSFFSKKAHQYWDLAGIAIGIPDAAQLLRNVPGKTKIFLSKAKNLSNHFFTTFPNTYRQKTSALINWMQGVKEGLKLQPGTAIQMRHLEDQILGLRVKNSFDSPNYDIRIEHITDVNGVKKRVANFNNTELANSPIYNNAFEITEMAGDLPRISPSGTTVWETAGTSGYTPGPIMKGVYYKAADGNDYLADIQVYISNNNLMLKVVSNLTGLEADFPRLYSFFNAKNWDFAAEVTEAFASKFRNADGLVDLTTAQRNALVVAMESWDITDFRKFRDYLIAQGDGLVGYFKSNLDTAPAGWKVLDDGGSALLTANDAAVRQRAIERMAEDLVAHADFDDFVGLPGNLSKWEKINAAVTGVSKKLAEWFENLWFSDRVIVDAPVGNSVTLKVEVNGSPQAIGKIENGDVNISGSAYDDVGAGPFLADDVLEVSEDGSHAIVKNADTGKAACRIDQCFPAGTPVLTTSGISLPIESIREGQIVAAWDDNKQDTVHAKVVRTFTKVANGLRRIITAGQDTILATREHPFYVPSLSQYLPADSIKTGMQLLTFTGALLSVIHHENLDTTVQVYNFEVEQYHNYFVGDEGVLVHNTCRLRAAGVTEADLVAAFPGYAEEVTRMRDKLHQLLGDEKLVPPGPLYTFFRKGNTNPIDPAVVQRRLHCLAALKNTDQQQVIASLEKVEAFLLNPLYPANPLSTPYWMRIQDNIAQAPSSNLGDMLIGLEKGVIRKFRPHNSSDVSDVHNLISGAFKAIMASTQYPNNRYKNVLVLKNININGQNVQLRSLSGYPYSGNFGNLVEPQIKNYENILGPPTPPSFVDPKTHTEYKLAEYLFSINQQISNGPIEIVTRNNYCSNCINVLDELQKDLQIPITRIKIPTIPEPTLTNLLN